MYDYRKLPPEEREAWLDERRAKGVPLHEPPHQVRDRSLYLLTAACYEHTPHMHTPARREELRQLLFEQLGGAHVKAWVVLPNHYHVLARIPDFDGLGDCMRRTHGPLSRRWNQEDETPGRKVWYRYTDRAIRSARHYAVTLNYIHYNPVKHGCAASPYEWEASSVHAYRERYGRDWLRALWRDYPVRDYGKGWDE